MFSSYIITSFSIFSVSLLVMIPITVYSVFTLLIQKIFVSTPVSIKKTKRKIPWWLEDILFSCGYNKIYSLCFFISIFQNYTPLEMLAPPNNILSIF